MPDIQEVIRRAAVAAQAREAAETRDQYLRIFAGLYDKARTYTTGVIAVTYAAGLGVWASVRTVMSPRQHAAAGLLLMASVATFVLWEVYSNIASAIALKKFALRLAQEPAAAVKSMKEFETERREADVIAGPAWATAVTITVLCGVAALGVMVWSLIKVLWTGLAL